MVLGVQESLLKKYNIDKKTWEEWEYKHNLDFHQKAIKYLDFQNTPEGYDADVWACLRYGAELVDNMTHPLKFQQPTPSFRDGEEFIPVKHFTGKKYPVGWYVYIFVDKNNKALYVGKTDRLRHRINEHLRGRSNTKGYLLKEVDQIYYLQLETQCDQELYEIYLISYYKPKYNKFSKGMIGKVQLDLPMEWNRFDIESVPAIKERDAQNGKY